MPTQRVDRQRSVHGDRGRRSKLGWGGLLVALLVMLIGLELPVAPGHGFLWLSVWNFTHIPAFMALAWILWRLAARRRGRRTPRAMRYGFVLVVGVFLAGATEALQFYGPRDADPYDLLRNLEGLAAGCLLIVAWDRRLPIRAGAARTAARIVAASVAVGIAGLAAWPAVEWASAYHDRNRRFPRLCDFESRDERRFLTRSGAEIEFTASPDEDWRIRGETVARIRFLPGTYPRVSLVEPFPDWSAYRSAVFELYSPESEPVQAVLRIDDDAHDETFDDRYNLEIEIRPGANLLRVDLDEVRTAPHGRRMDMGRIRSLTLYLRRPQRPVMLYTDAWRLEGRRIDPRRTAR